jgi:hypothetical protein
MVCLFVFSFPQKRGVCAGPQRDLFGEVWRPQRDSHSLAAVHSEEEEQGGGREEEEGGRRQRLFIQVTFFAFGTVLVHLHAKEQQIVRAKCVFNLVLT